MGNPRTFAATSGGRTPRTDPSASSDSGGTDTTTDQPALPEHSAINHNPATIGAEPEYAGASFIAEKRVSFGRIGMRIFSTGPPITARFAIYQHPSGIISSQLPLIASATFTPSAGRRTIAIDQGGNAFLVPGYYWIIWGEEGGGNYVLRTFQTADIQMFNVAADLLAGEHPTIFRTTLSASAVPPSLDPLIGGASGVTATTDQVIPQVRLVP